MLDVLADTYKLPDDGPHAIAERRIRQSPVRMRTRQWLSGPSYADVQEDDIGAELMGDRDGSLPLAVSPSTSMPSFEDDSVSFPWMSGQVTTTGTRYREERPEAAAANHSS